VVLEFGTVARHNNKASLGGGGSAVLKEDGDVQLGRMSPTRLHGLEWWPGSKG
jgi:hypothetical protein